MAVRWSRIHAELGVAPGDLTYDMIVRAVEQRVAETEDLDWKQTLPVDVDKKLKDFAKDVAAMANTGGGVIVYGVREERSAPSRSRRSLSRSASGSGRAPWSLGMSDR